MTEAEQDQCIAELLDALTRLSDEVRKLAEFTAGLARRVVDGDHER